MDNNSCGATPVIPNSIKERLAAALVEALVARAKAQAAVTWVATFCELSEDSTATLLAELVPQSGGKVPSGETDS